MAFSSEFKDFEDAIQFYCALEHGIKVLLTRNLKDYTQPGLTVFTAE